MKAPSLIRILAERFSFGQSITTIPEDLAGMNDVGAARFRTQRYHGRRFILVHLWAASGQLIANEIVSRVGRREHRQEVS